MVCFLSMNAVTCGVYTLHSELFVPNFRHLNLPTFFNVENAYLSQFSPTLFPTGHFT